MTDTKGRALTGSFHDRGKINLPAPCSRTRTSSPNYHAGRFPVKTGVASGFLGKLRANPSHRSEFAIRGSAIFTCSRLVEQHQSEREQDARCDSNNDGRSGGVPRPILRPSSFSRNPSENFPLDKRPTFEKDFWAFSRHNAGQPLLTILCDASQERAAQEKERVLLQ